MSTADEFYKHFPDFTWDYTPDQINQRATTSMNNLRKIVDQVLQLPDDKISFASALEPIAFEDSEFEVNKNIIGLTFATNPNAEVRNAATNATKLMSEFIIEIEMKIEIYQLLQKVRAHEKTLDPESERYLNKCLLYKKRSGLHLSKDVRDKLEVIYKEMSKLCIDFEKNISEENVLLKFTKEQLEGMQHDFIASLDKDGDHYIVTLKYPHVLPLLKHCKVVSTRKTVEKAFNSRCIDTNVEILEKIVTLRHEKAQILGYNTHADFITEILMSKNSKTVEQFLTSLADKLKDSANKEKARLLELKEQECIQNSWTFDGNINTYDMSYYQRMVEEQDFKVDHNLLKEYFPFEFVTEKLLELYQTLLSLKFVKVDETKVWHPEVSLYAVYCKKTDHLLGYFYLDLFPREGKYTHAACFGIQGATNTRNGYRLNCAAMVANFTKPLSDKPSLLTHDEVETYFHEFGHVMHHVCSRSRYDLFHGTSVERDFVEAPSQMLENWVWEKESLKKISCHYLTKQSLDDVLIDKLINSRKANVSLYYLRQIALSMFDYTIHTKDKVNTLEVIKKCWKQYIGYEPQEGTNFAAAFGHMCGGYDAQYYGYLWSQVYSCDMFVSRFKKEGIFNPETGFDYRTMILQPGSTKDASDLLFQFLGRHPIQEPFLQITGILPP